MNIELKNRLYLLKELTKRDIYGRYKGSFLGICWAFLTPLAMLGVFSFVFGEIFRAKWGGDESLSQIDFSINLFIGLSFFWFFADYLSRAPMVFISSVNYVKKVIFPLEILPLVNLLSGLFHFLIYVFIIMLAIVLTKGSLSLSSFGVFFIVGTSLPMLYGFGLLLGSLGVFIRDIPSVIGVVINMLMFLSPIFYPLSAVPSGARWLFELNPLTIIIEESRKCFMMGEFFDLKKLGIYFLFSVVILVMGIWVFKKTKRGFSDVL